MCQQAYFVGHHRKAPALFAGAGGFDGGVQGQQVGLLGNAADHADNAADLLGMAVQFADLAGRSFYGLGDLVHARQRFLNHAAAFAGLATRLAGLGMRFHRIVRDMVDTHGQLLDRGRHRGGRARLFLG